MVDPPVHSTRSLYRPLQWGAPSIGFASETAIYIRNASSDTGPRTTRRRLLHSFSPLPRLSTLPARALAISRLNATRRGRQTLLRRYSEPAPTWDQFSEPCNLRSEERRV